MVEIKGAFSSLISRFGGSRINSRMIGMDIGSTSIKLMELERTGNGVRLIRQLIQELPAPAATAGGPGPAGADRDGWLRSVLKESAAEEVHLSIEGPEVAVRRVTIPPMSANERAEAIKWQVKDQVPFPIQEAVLDYRIVGEVWNKDLKQSDVLVAAAETAYVKNLVGAVERAGARVASVIPTSLALWTCLRELLEDVKKGSIVVLEMGASSTHIAIIKDGQVRVVRDIGIGSINLTEALTGVVASEKGEVTIDETMAEAFKRRYGILGDQPEGSTDEGVPLFHIASLMRPVLESLLTEMTRFLDFYKVQMEGGGVSRIFLCGGGANLKSLAAYLADGLGVTVEVFNPLMRITDRAGSLEAEVISESGPRLAVAAGVCLRQQEDMDLLPSEIRKNRATAAAGRGWMKALGAVGVVAIASLVGLYAWSWFLGGKVREMEGAWGSVEPAYRETLQVVTETKRLENPVISVDAFGAEQPIWKGVLIALSQQVPNTIELSLISIDGGKKPRVGPWSVSLKGTVFGKGALGPGGIAEFVERLRESPFFKEVRLSDSMTRAGLEGRTDFHIEAMLK